MMNTNSRGVEAAQAGDLAKAELLFKQAYAEDPSNQGIFQNIIRAMQMRGDIDGLIDYYEQERTENRNLKEDKNIEIQIIELALKAGRQQKAKRILWNRANQGDYSTAIIAPLTEILFDNNELERAKELLVKAIEIDRDDPSLLTNLAVIETELGNYTMAEALYKRVTETRPNEFLGLYNMSRFMLTTGRAESAQNYLNKANQAFANTPESQELQREINNYLEQENMPLGQYYLKVKNKEWQSAKDILVKIKNSISQYKWLAAACELPNEQIKDLSMEKNCDPSQLVSTCQLIDENDLLIQELIDAVEKDQSLTWNRASKPTSGGFQTHEILKHTRIEALKLIKKRIKAQVNTVYSPKKEKDYELSGWGVVLKSGGYQKKHTHTDAYLSGVIYLSIPPMDNQTINAGDLLFTGTNPLYIKPQRGLMVLFPSYLPHETIPFNKNAKRICIAFNIKQNEASQGEDKSQQTQI